jgi:ATP-dependent RNA helicase DeaD
VPESADAYVHRIGRTGRAGRTGVAITLFEPREHRMLRTIEQLTRQRIEIAKLPTAVDVRATRLEQTRLAIREAIAAGDLDGYRVIVESLSAEFDPMDVATAAVKLAHLAGAGAGEVEAAEDAAAAAPVSRPRGGGAGMRRIYVGAGRKAKIRPADLVGAIVNEADLPAASIGAIEIADRFSLIEVPEDQIDRIVDALRASTIKGKRQTVRRDQANR